MGRPELVESISTLHILPVKCLIFVWAGCRSFGRSQSGGAEACIVRSTSARSSLSPQGDSMTYVFSTAHQGLSDGALASLTTSWYVVVSMRTRFHSTDPFEPPTSSLFNLHRVGRRRSGSTPLALITLQICEWPWPLLRHSFLNVSEVSTVFTIIFCASSLFPKC